MGPNCATFEIHKHQPPIDAAELSGAWVGAYTCAQGLTGLTLTVTGAGTDLDAVFAFYPLPQNPSVPSGSFRMSGVYNGEGAADFEAGAWIERPSGFTSVEFESDFDLLAGTIRGTVCGNPFTVSLVRN